MHPCHSDHAIAARGLRVHREAFGDEFLEVLFGSVQFIPVVMHYSEKVVRKSRGGMRQPARRRVIQHRLRQQPCLLKVASLDSVEACRE